MTSKTRYRLEARIGDGGMAEVYRAAQLGDEGWRRDVAIKRVLPHLARDPAFSQMFVREARIAARLNHSNIVSVVDFLKEDEDELLLVMELVDGLDLATIMDTGAMPVEIACYILGSILSALRHAHSARSDDDSPLHLVHRDVSPHNVLVSWDGAVKLSDFGIAKIAEGTQVTRTGWIKGKVAYLSPEQALCQPLDGRSDLFAAGIIFHEMLTGEKLFGVETGAREAAVVHRVLNLPIPTPSSRNPDVPISISDLAMHLLERELSRRCPDATTALDRLSKTGAASIGAERALVRLLKDRFPMARLSEERPSRSEATPIGSLIDRDTDRSERSSASAARIDLGPFATPVSRPRSESSTTLPDTPKRRARTVTARFTTGLDLGSGLSRLQIPRIAVLFITVIALVVLFVAARVGPRTGGDPALQALPTDASLMAPSASPTLEPPSPERTHEVSRPLLEVLEEQAHQPAPNAPHVDATDPVMDGAKDADPEAAVRDPRRRASRASRERTLVPPREARSPKVIPKNQSQPVPDMADDDLMGFEID